MRGKDKIQQRLADILKTKRSEVRTKHSIAADNELNEVLPRVEAAFYKAVSRGELPDDIKT